MLDENLEDQARRLLARLDALAATVAASGVSDEAASRLLGSASTAVLQALTLDELVAAATAEWIVAPAPVPIAPAAGPAEPDVPLAA